MAKFPDGTPKTENSVTDFVFHLTNCGSKDRKFFTEFFALFTDPHNQDLAKEIRSGDKTIQYCPDTGEVFVADLIRFSPN